MSLDGRAPATGEPQPPGPAIAAAGPESPARAGAAAVPVLGGAASAIALALTMFVEAVGYGMVAPTLPFLARTAGAGETQIGFLVGLYAAVGLLVGIPFSALASRYGRRVLVLIGLGCLTAASLGFVVAPTYGWLVVARFAQGLGASAIWVGALTIAADLSPDASMGRSLAWITGSWSLGFVVGPALGGIGSVRFPFLAYAVLSGGALLVAFFALPETGRPGVRTSLAGILRILKYPAVLGSAAATFALSFFYGAFEAFTPLLADDLHVRRIGIGLLFAIAGLPSIALPRLTGQIADRIGDTRLIIAGLVYSAALCALFLPLVGMFPLWVTFFLAGMVEVLIYVPAVALLNRGMDRDERVYATGSHSYAFSLGFFLGPLVGGALMPHGGYPLLFAALTVVMIAATIALVRLRGRIESA
jgi:predicted MFS family arabinose efflux permease